MVMDPNIRLVIETENRILYGDDDHVVIEPEQINRLEPPPVDNDMPPLEDIEPVDVDMEPESVFGISRSVQLPLSLEVMQILIDNGIGPLGGYIVELPPFNNLMDTREE